MKIPIKLEEIFDKFYRIIKNINTRSREEKFDCKL